MAAVTAPLVVWRAAIAALCIGAAVPASAQVVQLTEAEALATAPDASVRLTQPTIDLSDAVTLALRHNVAIRQRAETLKSATGRLRETRGLFDPTVRFVPSATFDLKEMAPFLKAREISKRETIRIIANNFTILTHALREMIATTPRITPRCPSDLQVSNGRLDLTRDNVDLSGRDEVERALLGVNTHLQSVIVELGDGLPVNLADICRSEPRELIAPELLIDYHRRIDQSGGLGLQGILESVSQIPGEMRILQEEITRTVAQRARLALDRLGPLADDELKRNITLDLNLSKLFRSGLQVSGDYQMQSQEQNFVDKPLDPTFGGFDTPPQFFSSATGTVTVPLGRGRGTAATAASERAAVQLVASEHEQFRHDISEEVFRTVLAYLNLVAAQQTVDELEASAGRRQQILTLSQGRLDAGELAEADVARVRASVAGVDGSLAQARSALVSARLALADQMGVQIDSLNDAPLAAQNFATASAPSETDVDQLIARALTSRRDLRAASSRRDAASALAAGARANARPRLDLTLTGGIYHLEDSPFFKFLPDEGGAIICSPASPLDDEGNCSFPGAGVGIPTPPATGVPVPPLDPVRYFSPVGYGRAIKGRHTPFATVSVTFELPFGNNTARGRVAQAEASVSSSAIQLTDLRRAIGDNVVELTESLRRTARALTEFETAAARGDETLTSQFQMFQAGDTTIIDTLLTEDSLTGDRLELVRQRQAYLSVLTRLQFEVGDLVTISDAGGAGGTLRFDPTAFAGQ